MTTYRYIEFDWNTSPTYKFKVPMGGMKTIIQKASNVSVSIDGAIDVSLGSIQYRFQYLIVCRDVADEIGYGTKDNLISLFERNNPNGTPSCRIPFKDHFGDQYVVVMLNNISPEPLSTILEGSSAVYYMPIELIAVAVL